MISSLLPDLVVRPLARSTELVRGALGSLTWGPGLAIAKPTVMAVLEQIEIGTLVLVDETSGTRTVLGENVPLDAVKVNGNGIKTNGVKTNGIKTNGVKVKVNGINKVSGVNGVNGINGVNGYDNDSDHDHDREHSTRSATTIPRVELVIHSEAFWMRVFLFSDMGFAEAYMLGEIECSDLTAFFQLFIVNRDRLGNGNTRLASLSRGLASLARTTNTLSNALLNISAHYDISNDMFAAFLSPDMTYSCPIWASTLSTANSGVVYDEPLEEAQMRKLDRFIDGARVKATDHVLEIGTGWGSLAMRAVQRTGCHVTSLTLSREQKALAEARIAAAGLADHITVLLMDYRTLATEAAAEGRTYDKIISIEMLEAVGQEYLATYFRCIHNLLKRDGSGIAVFQCITMPEGRHTAYSKNVDFINHYIFPGGYLPSTTQLLHHITAESAGTLIVERVENIGGHYARTLRLWRESFLARFEDTIRPALRREHAGMSDAEMEVFRRKWEVCTRCSDDSTV